MVLNEPETSLHPDLVGPLASLIRAAAEATQVIVVTHSTALLDHLGAVGNGDSGGDAIQLKLRKDLGETCVAGLTMLTAPAWDWGKR